MADIVPTNVKRLIAPGIWQTHDDVFHVDPSPYLRHCGLPDTKENQDAVIEMAKAIFRQEAPGAIIIDQFDK